MIENIKYALIVINLVPYGLLMRYKRLPRPVLVSLHQEYLLVRHN